MSYLLIDWENITWLEVSTYTESERHDEGYNIPRELIQVVER